MPSARPTRTPRPGARRRIRRTQALGGVLTAATVVLTACGGPSTVDPETGAFVEVRPDEPSVDAPTDDGWSCVAAAEVAARLCGGELPADATAAYCDQLDRAGLASDPFEIPDITARVRCRGLIDGWWLVVYDEPGTVDAAVSAVREEQVDALLSLLDDPASDDGAG